MPYFNQWGWHTETVIEGRYTDVPVPTDIPQGHAANWTGHQWRVIPYYAPIVQRIKAITRKQFKIALYRKGRLTAFTNWASAHANIEIRILWADSDIIERDDALINLAQQELGITNAVVDGVWEEALNV
jgi:hypothetical protein